jgi:predicted RNA-binding Zn-ribbon protein involved in translation (DUF1610 family)
MKSTEPKVCLICAFPLSKETLHWGDRYFCPRCGKHEIIFVNEIVLVDESKVKK